MVSRDSGKIVTFDWESALDFNGQAAPYIQYAYVRANSILKKYNAPLPASINAGDNLSASEIALIDLIARMPGEIQKAAKELKPLTISNLAYELAKAFNDFYSQCPVLIAEEPVKSSRIRLCGCCKTGDCE